MTDLVRGDRPRSALCPCRPRGPHPDSLGQCGPGPCGRRPAVRRGDRRAVRGRRVRGQDRPGRRGRARGDREEAGAGGQADRAALRAPRRPADRRRRGVDLGAVRADRARRPAVRPRCGRRQGRDRRAPGRRTGLWQRSAGGRDGVRRGRGGDRFADPAAAARRVLRRAGRRRDRDRRLGQLGRSASPR